MKIVRMFIREIGGQQPAYTRSYTAQDVSQRDIIALAEATNRGMQLNNSNLCGLGGRLIAPSAQAGNQINIAGGWQDRRWFWIAHIEMATSRSTHKTRILSGFVTNWDSVSYSGLISPDAEFVINNSVEINNSLVLTGAGQQWVTNARDAQQILLATGQQWTRPLARPEDLFSRKVYSETYDSLGDEGSDWFDLRQGFNEGALKVSSRQNSVASRYLSRSLRAWSSALDNAPYMGAGDDGEIAAIAQGNVRETLLSDDAIFIEMANDSNVLASGFVTWHELLTMPGNTHLDSVTDILPDPKLRGSLSVGAQSESWRSSAPETIVALQASQAIMSIMMDLMYTELKVTLTNNTHGGQFVPAISKWSTFTDQLDPMQNYSALLTRLEVEVMREVSLMGQRIIDLSIDCDIFGECTVTVSIDNQPPVMYNNANFADSLSSMVICDNYDQLDTLSTRITSLVTEVRNVQNAIGHAPSPLVAPRAYDNSFI